MLIFVAVIVIRKGHLSLLLEIFGASCDPELKFLAATLVCSVSCMMIAD